MNMACHVFSLMLMAYVEEIELAHGEMTSDILEWSKTIYK